MRFNITFNYISVDCRIVRLKFLGAAVMFRGTGMKKNMNVVTTIIPLNTAAASCALPRGAMGDAWRTTPHPLIYTQAASSKQQAASSKQQAASSKQQAASSKQQAASSKQQARIISKSLRSKYLYLPNKKTVYGSLCFFSSENITCCFPYNFFNGDFMSTAVRFAAV